MPDRTPHLTSNAAPAAGTPAGFDDSAAVDVGMANPVNVGVPTKAEIVEQLEQAVLGIAGVVRLVPSLKDAISRLRTMRPSGSQRSEPNPHRTGDGITLTITDDAVTAVLVVSVRARTSVLDTALAVQAAAAGVLDAAYPDENPRHPAHRRHAVRVNVLSLEPDPSPGPLELAELAGSAPMAERASTAGSVTPATRPATAT
ncbi:MAG: hypothetical protein ABJA74_14405 [Lapillicoccus sp.]